MNFTLIVRPDGRAILTTPRNMTERHAEAVRDAWERWLEGPDSGALIIPECDVVQVHHIDLDLDIDCSVEVEASSP